MTLARETINAIMTTVARTHDWGSRWAYDGKKSLYSIDPKLPFPEVGFVAEIEEEGRKSQFRVQVSCALSLPFLLNTKSWITGAHWCSRRGWTGVASGVGV